MSNLSLKEKLLNTFSNPVYNTVTVAQAVSRFRVAPSTVTTAISELRREGVAIYTNRKTLEDGRKISFYRLGKPSKRFVRNMRAGRTDLAIGALTGRGY